MFETGVRAGEAVGIEVADVVLKTGTATVRRGKGGKGRTIPFGPDDALYKSLRERADTAGLTGFHPHKLRHTAAHRWLAAGGSESGLKAVAG